MEVEGLHRDKAAGGLVDDGNFFVVRFRARKIDKSAEPALTLAKKALDLIVTRGGWGARTQIGCGQVEFADPAHTVAVFDTAGWRYSAEFNLNRPAPTLPGAMLDLACEFRAEVSRAISVMGGLDETEILGRMDGRNSLTSRLEVGVRISANHAPIIRMWCISISNQVSQEALQNVVAAARRNLGL